MIIINNYYYYYDNNSVYLKCILRVKVMLK